MTIVDANVLAACFLEGGDRHVRARARVLGAERLGAPALWRTEFLSVLRRYVATAVVTGARLLTFDRELLRSFPGIAMEP